MRFEKWQALGNDYVIVERADLPFELTPERVRRLCAPHTGLGSDGILLLSEPDERGYAARLRIFNPDGSEAELSGNGARQAILYLRRNGGVDSDLFPNRTNVSFWRRDSDREITARIFERGVGETMASGTGAAGAAVAAVLRGLDSPVTVHLDGGDLEVDVGEDLHVDLTGWAVPVYSGELAAELLEDLREA